MSKLIRSGCSTYLLVGSLAFVCYINSICGGFVFDDHEAILGNKDVDPSTTSLSQVFQNDFWGTRVLSSSSHKSYRPLTVMTFRLNYWFSGGLHPFNFHLVNILLHVAVSLLYLQTCCVICTHAADKETLQGKLTPVIAALFFAVHPIHTESVAGVVGRAELMSALCFFVVLLCYIRACDDDLAVWKMICWLTVSLSATIGALLFKEQGITVAGVCIVYDILLKMKLNPSMLMRFKHPKTDSSWWRFSVRLLIVLCSATGISVIRLSTGSPTFKSIDNAAAFAESAFTRVLSYNYIYALNGWLLLTPWWLCFDWSMGCVPLLESLLDPRFLAVILFWVTFGSLIIYSIVGNQDSTKRLVSMSLGMIVITFLPASNLFIGVGFVVAERVLYLPSAGYCLLVALGTVKLAKHSNKLVSLGVVITLTIFIFRSVVRSSQWLTEEDLFVSGISVCRYNAKVLYNIGKVKSDAGDDVIGIAAYREAIRLYPEYDQALNNLGNLLKDRGNMTEEAEELFHRALDVNPTFSAAWMNQGIVQAALGKFTSSEESYQNAIKHRKNYPDAYYNLGNLYLDIKRHADAIEAYKSTIRLRKDHTSAWNNLGLLYENLNMYDKAEEVMRRSIDEMPDCAQCYSALGVLLGKQNRLEEGKKLLETAVTMNPLSGDYHANLGVICHLMKDLQKAEESYKLALYLSPDMTLARENLNKLMSTKQKQSK